MANRSEALHPQPSPESEALLSPVELSSRVAQEAVFGAIYSYLNTHTQLEIKGMLKEEGVRGNVALRGVLKQLAINLGKDNEYSPAEWLFVGITDFIPNDQLRKWAHPKRQPHWTEEVFHRTARYFEQKATPSEEKV